LPPLIVICALGLTASSAFSQEKGKERTETKGKHGREANELPYGLESVARKKRANFHQGYKKRRMKRGI
jgi:hypothetical protein